MQDKTYQEIEQSIQQSKQIVELGDALDRLYANRDFKQVVMSGLFEREAIRLVHLKAAPDMQSPEAQQSIIRRMDAIGTFDQYLRDVSLQAGIARKSADLAEQTRDEMLAEGNE